MKKICNLATVHPRDDVRIFRKECCAEAPYYEVHYVTCDGRGDELTKGGIRIHGIKRYKSKLLRALFAPFEIYKQAKVINADTYILHDPELLLIALLLKKSSKCVIWDCHEYYEQDTCCTAGYFFYPILVVLRLLFKAVCHIVVPRLDGCVAATEGIKTLLKSKNGKVCLLHNYALLKEFGAVRMPGTQDTRHILYAGSVTPLISNLIRALTLCKNDIRLILCCRAVSKNMPINLPDIPGFAKVDYMRNFSIEEIQLLSQKCFAGLCTPLPYNLNKNMIFSHNKIYEYMAMSLTNICPGFNNNAFIKNLVNNNGHPLGLVVDSDPQAIANAIDYLYENKEVARTMGMNGRKAFETKYNFESEADGFLKFLEEVSQSKNQNK